MKQNGNGSSLLKWTLDAKDCDKRVSQPQGACVVNTERL